MGAENDEIVDAEAVAEVEAVLEVVEETASEENVTPEVTHEEPTLPMDSAGPEEIEFDTPGDTTEEEAAEVDRLAARMVDEGMVL